MNLLMNSVIFSEDWQIFFVWSESSE